MTHTRKPLRALALAGALLATAASPASAIVGGHDAPNGAYPSVARITFGNAFLCTGTLIAPNYVLTAGHCGSVTGEVASPAAWPAALITVRIGGDTASTGEAATVSSVTVHPNHLADSGYDITLLKLSKNATKAPTKVAGATETSSWAPSTLEKIAGWGTTTEGGSTPNHLQEASVPITTDAYCANAYSDFNALTMVCAGYPQGGTDTCQGDSGGPMFGTVGGLLKVVGATSYGNGCAQPGYPGVYARVADSTLREWIRSKAPAGVD
jgi:secreted trypsin-like serine protease